MFPKGYLRPYKVHHLYAVCKERVFASAEGLWRRPKRGEGQMLCGCATDWEDIISVSMRDPDPFRIRGGTVFLIIWPSRFKLGSVDMSEIRREGLELNVR
jgi:hypothetical protein